jgi:hypothetical protein
VHVLQGAVRGDAAAGGGAHLAVHLVSAGLPRALPQPGARGAEATQAKGALPPPILLSPSVLDRIGR